MKLHTRIYGWRQARSAHWLVVEELEPMVGQVESEPVALGLSCRRSEVVDRKVDSHDVGKSVSCRKQQCSGQVSLSSSYQLMF
jgi:hypothetical protein